jgi:transcriptional regulator with XRE-family HTH domain
MFCGHTGRLLELSIGYFSVGLWYNPDRSVPGSLPVTSATPKPVLDALAIRRKIIGVLLQGARLRSGKTKKECGEVIGVSASAMGRFEDGSKDITLPQLELLAYALNVPVVGFFEDREQEKLVTDEPPLPAEQVVALRDRIIGVLLRKARSEAGQSQKDLAGQLGVSARRIAQYEYGQRPIPVVHLQHIADVLRLSMSYFLDEGVGRIGQREQVQSQFERFSELPEEVREFVSRYTNLPYLRVAMRISDMDADRIRKIAEGLLDITY